MNLSNSCIFHEFSVQMSYMALRGPSVRKGTLERHSSVGTVHSRRSQTRERVSVREQDPGEGEKPKKKGEGEKGKERKGRREGNTSESKRELFGKAAGEKKEGESERQRGERERNRARGRWGVGESERD